MDRHASADVGAPVGIGFISRTTAYIELENAKYVKYDDSPPSGATTRNQSTKSTTLTLLLRHIRCVEMSAARQTDHACKLLGYTQATSSIHFEWRCSALCQIWFCQRMDMRPALCRHEWRCRIDHVNCVCRALFIFTPILIDYRRTRKLRSSCITWRTKTHTHTNTLISNSRILA